MWSLGRLCVFPEDFVTRSSRFHALATCGACQWDTGLAVTRRPRRPSVYITTSLTCPTRLRSDYGGASYVLCDFLTQLGKDSSRRARRKALLRFRSTSPHEKGLEQTRSCIVTVTSARKHALTPMRKIHASDKKPNLCCGSDVLPGWSSRCIEVQGAYRARNACISTTIFRASYEASSGTDVELDPFAHVHHSILALMFLDRFPQLRILFHANFLARVQLVVAREVNISLEQRLDVWVEGLPVWVLEMIPARVSVLLRS